MYAGDKIILVDDAKDAVLNFINDHFHLLLPFEVRDGYWFQIRLSKAQHQKLTKEEKEILLRYSQHPDSDQLDHLPTQRDRDRYCKTRYWKNTKSYMFDYKTRDALELKARCVYGYEGLDDSVDYIFVEKGSFDELILANINKQEYDDWKSVRRGK